MPFVSHIFFSRSDSMMNKDVQTHKVLKQMPQQKNLRNSSIEHTFESNDTAIRILTVWKLVFIKSIIFPSNLST